MPKLKLPEITSKPCQAFIVYVQCYFVTIATILGTGVLGLPITLSHSGLYPFLVSFVLGFLAQALLVYFITDVLQRAYAVQLEAAREYGREENMPLYAIVDDESLDDDIAIEVRASDGSVLEDLAGHVILPTEDSVKSPNLHMMADFFLGCGVKQMFDVSLILTFVAILVSYALAGSQAYAQIIGINPTYVIPVFVWVLTCAIIFALKLIQPVVSLMTFIKGSVLLITVAVAFIPGSQINNTINNDFSHIGQPFLMGTVALGGMFQTMPMLYAKIKPSTIHIRNYRRAILSGLATCAFLNILWCWAVLEIVPQVPQSCPNPIPSADVFLEAVDKPCIRNISLETAGNLGQISTVPLTDIIHNYYPAYKWIAILTQVFIMISITVSFMTIGAAMHHTLCGWIEGFWTQDNFSAYHKPNAKSEKIFQTGHAMAKVIDILKRLYLIFVTVCGWIEAYWTQDRFSAYQAKLHLKSQKICKQCNMQVLCSSFLSLMVFSVVFTVAMINPKGFETVLEKFASFMLNLHSGFFMFLMIRRATSENGYGYLKIPLPLPHCVTYLQVLLPMYFGFAIGYDIYTIIHDIILRH